MADLTDDEYTVLLIARDGQYLAPLGRWKKPVLDLAGKGLLQRLNDVNYVITPAGRNACEAREQADDCAMLALLVGDKAPIEEGTPDSDVEE